MTRRIGSECEPLWEPQPSSSCKLTTVRRLQSHLGCYEARCKWRPAVAGGVSFHVDPASQLCGGLRHMAMPAGVGT